MYEVSSDFDTSIAYLRNQIEKVEAEEGTLNFENLRLRFAKATTVNGEQWCSARRIPIRLPDLAELLISKDAIDVIRSWGRSRGIMLVSGATGAGKTTTTAAILKDYVKQHGGAAVTLEDPVEYLLQGQIGERGACYQLEIEDDNWTEAVKRALRWRPRYIFIGEIRTPEAAKQALRASTSGHLVLATIHGGDVTEAIGAMISLSTDRTSDSNNLLADNLVGVVHQHLGRLGPELHILSRKKRETEPVVDLIRNGRLSRISQYVEEFLPSSDR